MYRVIEMFHDLQDCVNTKGGKICHQYNPGDEFPRAGVTVSPERIAELAGPDNARGIPLIMEVPEGPAVSVVVPEVELVTEETPAPAPKKTSRRKKTAEG